MAEYSIMLFKDIPCSNVAAQNKDPVPILYLTLDFRFLPDTETILLYRQCLERLQRELFKIGNLKHTKTCGKVIQNYLGKKQESKTYSFSLGLIQQFRE